MRRSSDDLVYAPSLTVMGVTLALDRQRTEALRRLERAMESVHNIAAAAS